MKITFINTFNYDVSNPLPASKSIPDWYKNTESYMNGEKKPLGDGTTGATIKRCMPVFDALNAGYILTTYADIWVKQIDELDKENNLPNGKKTALYEWAAGEPMTWHLAKQVLLHPQTKGNSAPKWLNPWGIKTPKGYSTLFVAPFHRNNPLSALPGIVDTDAYTAPVNIIFTLSDPNFEGLIPAGTPIVQVIPFKRDNFQMEIGNDDDRLAQRKVSDKLNMRFFDKYKDMFRAHKEYK